MNRTPNIGKRIELISMDSHFADISIGLYEQDSGGKPVFLVHTYSTLAGAPERMKFLVSAIASPLLLAWISRLSFVGFVERAQHRIHAGLVAPALFSEPVHHVGIEPHRKLAFRAFGINHAGLFPKIRDHRIPPDG